MNAKTKTPVEFQPVRPRTLADVKAEIDAKLANELALKASQYEADQRRALGL